MKYSIVENIEFQNFDGDSVLLDLNTGNYFGLNEIGTDIWLLLEKKFKIDEIKSRLIEIYDIDSEQIELDVENFIEKMSENNLLVKMK